MKKPKKRNERTAIDFFKNSSFYEVSEIRGYNKGITEMEAYYKQHIKENYIREDKFPSVAELAGILDAHRHCSISMQARSVLNRIRSER